MKKMLASEYIVSFIESKGVTHVFELTGGMISHLLDAFHQKTSVKIVSVHHEQGAAFAADAYSRVKNIPGVAIASSGPGAINLLTGVGNCYFDSVPALFITGQVNTNEQKGDSPVRQLGFQETDIVAMAAPICKKAYRVTTIESIPAIFNEAWEIAISDRPGPVLIDIPMNLQRTELDLPNEETVIPKQITIGADIQDKIAQLKEAIQKSNRPLILAGRGIRSSGSEALFRWMTEYTKIPVVSSLLGLDVLEYNHPCRAGFIGVYGNRWANLAIGECDLMIVLGSRLDIRQTGADTLGFKSDKTIFHVDCEKAELNYRLKNCITVQADLNEFLESFRHTMQREAFEEKTNWLTRIKKLKAKHPDTEELKKIKGINPNQFLHLLSQKSKQAACFLADVGNHQMWCAQSLELQKDQLFITSGGMGAMGYALPAAIGACLAFENKPVVAISGDGGFQINIQELQTIMHSHLPIKMVVLNNQSLGMIRQFQDSYFDSRHIASIWGYSAPNFEKVALAYGIEATTIANVTDNEEGLSQLWKDPNQPFLLQVMIEPTVNAYPKIAFGSPIHIMEPLIDDHE